MRYLSATAAVAIVLGSTIAVGQVIYNNASTAGEGYQRGMSSVISAAGEASVNASQARINNQDAYSAAIDNSTKSVEAFLGAKGHLPTACGAKELQDSTAPRNATGKE